MSRLLFHTLRNQRNCAREGHRLCWPTPEFTACDMTLAIFDLDNTLIAGDSDHLWGVFVCEQGLVVFVGAVALHTTRPLTEISGGRVPTMAASSEDLPVPEGPITVTISPGATKPSTPTTSAVNSISTPISALPWHRWRAARRNSSPPGTRPSCARKSSPSCCRRRRN